MSLLYANSIYQKADNQPEHSGIEIIDDNNTEVNKNLQVKKMMEFFGFKDVKTYYLGEEGNENSDGSDYCRNYKDTHKSKVAIGYKNIEYHGIEKTVVGIVIRGTSEDDDWDSDFDMGDLELRDLLLEDYEGGHDKYRDNFEDILKDLKEGLLDYDKKYANELLHFAGGYPDWTHKYHHAGFDIVANRVMEILEEYMDKNHYMNGNICYWVTGHSMGAGVANLVGAELLHGYSGINNRTDNVYCYTFVAPNTFYLTDNTNIRQNIAIPNAEVIETYREPHGIKYRCIFNVVNDDDFVPKLPMEECEWTRYGRTAKKSIEKDVKRNITQDKEYYDYVKNKYKTNLNSIKNIIKSFNNMYEDKLRMRYDSYQYVKTNGKEDYAKFNNKEDYEKGLAFYAKPYQKYIKNKDGSIQQYQMPAYVMQSITNAIHERVPFYEKDERGNTKLDKNGLPIINNREQEPKLIMSENQWTFRDAVLANDKLQSSAWEMFVGEGIFKAIDCPHYTESYYSLSKEIVVTDFRLVDYD